jgi:hypothetical protein
MTAEIEVALTTEELATVSVGDPGVQFNETAAPGSKPAPAITTVVSAVVAAKGSADGLTLVMPNGITVKAPASITVPPSGLTTVTLYVPAASVPPVIEFVG